MNQPKFTSDFKTLEGMLKYAKLVCETKLCPKELKDDPKTVVLIIQQGLELGMQATQAIQQIVVIEGVPVIKGDGCKALIMQSNKCSQWQEVEGDDGYTITATRSDTGETKTQTYSTEMAIRAGLWIENPGPLQKKLPWYTHPGRMKRYRALGFIARDLFPDVLKGIVTLEEVRDYPKQTIDSKTITDGAFSKIVDMKKKQ